MGENVRRVAFAGTPEFAAIALRALLAAGWEVPFVLTQPDRPAGCGMKLSPSPVKRVAQAAGIAVLQPARLKSEEDRRELLALPAPDVLVVAAYGLILPSEVLHWPRWGCLNIHASLLPRWRGAAPVQRAILAGDTETGEQPGQVWAVYPDDVPDDHHDEGEGDEMPGDTDQRQYRQGEQTTVAPAVAPRTGRR